MPIGPQVPGSPTVVTPDGSPGTYISTQGPAPDGLVVADDVLAVHLIALNVQAKAASSLYDVSQQVAGVAVSYPLFVDLFTGTTIIAAASSGFTKDQNYGKTSWQQSLGLVANDGVSFSISNILPKYGRISLVRAYAYGTGHSDLPVTRPQVKLCRVLRSALATQDVTVIGTGADLSGSVGVFDAAHAIDCIQNLPHLIDHSYEYHVRLSGEYGVNAQVGFRFISLQLEVIA